MATYEELFILSQDQSLLQRITIAVAIAAEEIRAEDAATPNHASRVNWAQRAIVNPDGMARQLLILALAQNRTLTAAQITVASDAVLQNAVDHAIGLLS